MPCLKQYFTQKHFLKTELAGKKENSPFRVVIPSFFRRTIRQRGKTKKNVKAEFKPEDAPEA
ncbi:MAG: hypothetical protein KDD06_25475, partial [Phaeodactylibacter sp.]|nr:hypothetical protein [Phaeodactylibacter sp.]